MGSIITLQDWSTLQGLNNTDVVVQSPDGWLDASPYTGVIIYSEVRDYAGGARLFVQTSPTADESLWDAMISLSISGTGLTTSSVRFSSASVPLSRLVRWKVDATAANWRVVFRITMALKTA